MGRRRLADQIQTGCFVPLAVDHLGSNRNAELQRRMHDAALDVTADRCAAALAEDRVRVDFAQAARDILEPSMASGGCPWQLAG